MYDCVCVGVCVSSGFGEPLVLQLFSNADHLIILQRVNNSEYRETEHIFSTLLASAGQESLLLSLSLSASNPIPCCCCCPVVLHHVGH